MKLSACVLAAYVGANTLVYLTKRKLAYNCDAICRPPPTLVSVIIPAWKEPRRYLEVSLSSLRDQNIVRRYPSFFEYIFVGCEGIDIEFVSRYVDKVLCAPRGKLYARHLGIQHSKGDIVVAVDADAYYPPNTLNLLLEPFHDPTVVAATAPTDQGVFEPFAHVFFTLYYSNRMSGRCSAFRKSAYYAIGGFNLAINQRNIAELIHEEEIFFKQRLEKLGRVEYVPAMVYHVGRRDSRGIWA